MTRTHTVAASPLGPLTLVVEDGALCGLYMTEQRHRPDPALLGRRDDGPGRQVVPQLEAYFAGELRDFDVPVLLVGTPFQRRVWAALTQIPYGQTRTYGELAAAVGQPTASRAVGLANGRNPVGIVVPCHRVVGSGGSLTGYGGGLSRKRALLELEAGRQAADSPAAGQLSLL